MTERLFEPTDTDTRLAFQRSVLEDPAVNTRGASHFGESDEVEAAAARLVAPRTGTLRAQVLDALTEYEPIGATMYQLSDALGALLYSVGPRLTELRRAGWIVDSQQRAKTPSGAAAVLWRVSERGLQALEEMGCD